MTDLPAIDRYADRKANELLRILEAIREFRNALYEAIGDEVVTLIAKRSPETRRRLQPFVDFRNVWRPRCPRTPTSEAVPTTPKRRSAPEPPPPTAPG